MLKQIILFLFFGFWFSQNGFAQPNPTIRIPAGGKIEIGNQTYICEGGPTTTTPTLKLGCVCEQPNFSAWVLVLYEYQSGQSPKRLQTLENYLPDREKCIAAIKTYNQCR